jgi:hypothetical protein
MDNRTEKEHKFDEDFEEKRIFTCKLSSGQQISSAPKTIRAGLKLSNLFSTNSGA